MRLAIKNFLIALCILFIVLTLSYFRIFDNLELPTFDLRYKLRPAQNFNKDIVIIEISDDTLKQLGSWPISRDFHAALVSILKEYGAKQIIFDIIFSDAASQDDDLAKAIKEAGNVYLPFVFAIDKKTKKHVYHSSKVDLAVLEKLKDASKTEGFISTVPDIDGKYRFSPLFIEYEKQIYPHISLISACDYLGVSQKDVQFIPGKFVKFGREIKIPLDNNSRALINYCGKWRDTFKHYSYYDILASYKGALLGEKTRINLNELKGKVCFIGLTATATCDLNPTPLETIYPMVGSNANLFNMIVANQPISRASQFLNIFILLVLSAAIIFINKRFRFFKGLIFTIAILSVLVIFSYISLAYFGIWIDLFYPVLILVVLYLCLNLFRYLNERRKNELMEKELSVARKIQESFLPKILPKLKHFEIAVLMVPARQIGGDLYDFVQIDKERIGIMIGDVSGKGVPAALFMAKVISDFRYFAKSENSPKDVLLKLNNKLSLDSQTGLFVTMNYLILDGTFRKLTVSNAGHFSPIIIRNSKPIELKFEQGPPLGILEGAEFNEVEFELEKDDSVILYTDGVVEARSIDTKEFGKEKLIGIIINSRHMAINDLLNKIKDAVIKFSLGLPQYDDFTIIVARCGKI